MKKELFELKETTREYMAAAEEFVAARKDFNASLDVTSVEGLANYYEETCTDAYDIARNFFMVNGDVAELATGIKTAHPRYGLPRFKSELVTAVIDARDVTFEEAHEVVNAYLLLEDAGYANVNALEENVTALGLKVNANSDAVVNQGKAAVTKAGKAVVTSVGNFARPYGQVAKGQLESAGVKAKGLVNKGTKQLIKVLGKLEDKTK